MGKEIFDKLQKTQLLELVGHFISDSPLGVVVLDDAFEVVYVNPVMEGLLKVSSNVKTNLFGNLFMCKTISDEDMLCGTRFQCSNCKIRNSILSANLQNRIIKNIKIKHTFVDEGIDNVKWFDISVFPFVIERKGYSVVLLNDQSDWMKNHINDELENLVEKRTQEDEQKRFKQRVVQHVKNSTYHEGQIVSIMPLLTWHATAEIKREVLNNFTTFILRNVDYQTIHANYHEGELLLFFGDHPQTYIDNFIEGIKQFCGINYEHQCQLAYKRLTVSFKTIKMAQNADQIALEAFVEDWIEILETIKATDLLKR